MQTVNAPAALPPLPPRVRARAGRTVMCLLSAAVFIGCLAAPGPHEEDLSRLRMNLSLERPASASMQLQALHIELRSSRGDTLRDTITDQGGSLSGAHVVLNPSPDQGQILMPRYDLPPAASWSYSLRSVDAHDSVIHHEESEVGPLAPGEAVDLALRLNARVAAYEAVFASLPSTFEGQDINLQRFALAIDGQTYQASTLTMIPGQPVRVLYEYLPVGARDVRTQLYGTIGEDPTSRVLWDGRTQLKIQADAGATVSVPLTWALPADALGKNTAALETMHAEVLLGRVGHIVMNVTMSAAIVL